MSVIRMMSATEIQFIVDKTVSLTKMAKLSNVSETNHKANVARLYERFAIVK